MDKHPYLVCYDYGTGGLWGVMLARSEEEIHRDYPELLIAPNRPKWMSEERYQDLLERECHDIDGQPWGILNALLSDWHREGPGERQRAGPGSRPRGAGGQPHRREHEVRDAWTAFHRSAGADAVAARSSHTILFALFDRYRSRSLRDREIVDRLLAEQLGSDDETTRFDALALIDEFGISSTLPELRALADRLEGTPGPGAPYEWAKVNRLIGDLTEGQDRARR